MDTSFKTLPTELTWKIWEMVDPDYMEVLRIRRFMPGNNVLYEKHKNSHYEKLIDIHHEFNIWTMFNSPASGCSRCSGSGAVCSDCSSRPKWLLPIDHPFSTR